MSETVDRLREFVEWAALLKGDEKGEAQVFCDRLFKAFGHLGVFEAGAELEHRSKGKTGTTRFLDLIWKPRLLLEMKRRGEKLNLHFQQAFDYWIHAVPSRPRYVVLCNFDEFWIYDFDKQIDEPMDIVRLIDLPKRYTALNFLFFSDAAPQFGNDRVAVSREAADQVAQVFRFITKRLQAGATSDEERAAARTRAQRFVLQLVVAMFAEDIDLLPSGMVLSIITDSLGGQSAFDLFGGLFSQMNNVMPAKGGRFQKVPFFNGGIFSTVDPVDLDVSELTLLEAAAKTDWAQVNPAIFGTLFQGSMDEAERHALGAHFTSEADIMRVVSPTIIQPWQSRIEEARTMKELLSLRRELLAFRVLDPACGSGNFCYVAFRALVRLELVLLAKLKDLVSAKQFHKQVKTLSLVSPKQFYGIDRDAFAIELAKVTLMLAKKLALDEAMASLEHTQIDLALEDEALPLDNLDANFACEDALFVEWPSVDAIVSNPPFQSKNKMQQEFGRAYLNRLRKRFPEVPGRADYCVFWLRLAHSALKPGQRAGMVGTNTIRQNYSREGGLDYITKRGGTITDAVASQVWSGDAAVHVSIVNWTKGRVNGPFRLSRQVGDTPDSPWESKAVDRIDAALSWEGVDVTEAATLRACAAAGGCYQGQTHGHSGFLLSRATAEGLLRRDPRFGQVLFPYLTADDLLGQRDGLPTRYVIDFGTRDVHEAAKFPDLFKRVQESVLASRRERANREQSRNAEARSEDESAAVTSDHRDALERWWLLFRRRGEMLKSISAIPRYIACGRVTKRPIFAFVSPTIHPSDVVMVFPYADDYSFGILQSDCHWRWFVARCSTLKGDYRYTSNTVFDSFPWPQDPSAAQLQSVAAAAVSLRETRASLHENTGLSLRELYRTTETPGQNVLKDAHAALDAAVRAAYGMPNKAAATEFLLRLNQQLAVREAQSEVIVGPGLPPSAVKLSGLVTEDSLSM